MKSRLALQPETEVSVVAYYVYSSGALTTATKFGVAAAAAAADTSLRLQPSNFACSLSADLIPLQ